MMRTYVVRFTTEDWDEFTYPVTTSLGALAAVESGMHLHHRSGYQIGDVRSVVASASGEHEAASDQVTNPVVRYDRLTGRPATIYTPPEDVVDEAHRFDHIKAAVEDEHSHGGTGSLDSGCGS